ncbi:MAG: translation initiation factor IF-2 subunit gamma, partial [Candidatus Woesearchaeota archaeon]
MVTKKTTKKVAKKVKSAIEENQPEINIGLVGHVDHGKTTLTKALSGKWTDTHSEEVKRGITIRLGYADTIIHKHSKKDEYSVSKDTGFMPVRKVSFIDAPGHESLMATMLAGSMIMDGALLLVSADEKCPQPQTREHLSALQMCGIENVIVVQNKIDLVSKERAKENYQEIRDFLKGTAYEKAAIIPISARFQINISQLLESIQTYIPTPKRNEEEDPILLIARSFDINKPGSAPSKMLGGIIGGSLIKGSLKVGDTIEIRPGRVYEKKNQQVTQPFKTKITGIQTGTTQVKKITPGGSVAIMTELDPSIVKSDKLVGNVVGLEDKLPPVWSELSMD